LIPTSDRNRLKPNRKQKMNHAKISPSGYKRWSNCPGSYTLQQKLGDLLPEDTGSDAANLGTELHDNAEQALKTGSEPREEVAFYVNYCHQASTAPDAEVFIEHQVPLFYSREEHGYADYIVRTDDCVHIIDLKTGRIPVEAENNYQLLIYAYGMATFNTERFKMTIVQNDTAKTWELDMAQAEAIASTIGVKAQAAMNEYIHDLVASDEACQWCPCKPFCSAYTERLLESFEDLTGDMKRLSDDKMAYLFTHSKQIKTTLAEIEKALFHRVNDGETINGVCITDGRRGNKTWSKDVDPVTIMARAGLSVDQATVSKPITVTQALKLADIDASAWTQPEGKPKLVAGEAYDPADDFDVLE